MGAQHGYNPVLIPRPLLPLGPLLEWNNTVLYVHRYISHIHLIRASLVHCITTGEWALGSLARAASKLSIVSFRLFRFDIKLFQGGLLSFPPLPRWFELPVNTDFTKVVPGLLFPGHLLTKGYLDLTPIEIS